MPGPDPQPPQPRTVPYWKWILLLLPSVPILLAPSRIETVGGRGPSEAQISHLLGKGLIGLALAAVLSFAFGFLLEKSQRGSLSNRFRAIGFGCAIFIVNCFVAFAGCTAFPLTIRP